VLDDVGKAAGVKGVTVVHQESLWPFGEDMLRLLAVMAGLVPAIHAFSEQGEGKRGCPAQGRA
jgi:hypothetical protein